MKLQYVLLIAVQLSADTCTAAPKQTLRDNRMIMPIPIPVPSVVSNPRSNKLDLVTKDVEQRETFTFDTTSAHPLSTSSVTTDEVAIMVKHHQVTTAGKERLRSIYAGKVLRTQKMLAGSRYEFDLICIPRSDATNILTSVRESNNAQFIEEVGYGKLCASVEEQESEHETQVLRSAHGTQPSSSVVVPGVFPNDPYFSSSQVKYLIPYITGSTYYMPAEQHHLYNQGNPSELFSSYTQPYSTLTEPGVVRQDISAPEAWSIRREAPDVIVGMFDTGIDYRHPDLLPNLWTNTAASYVTGTNTPDTHGVFISGRTGIPEYSGNIMDTYPHGTHTASIIGAVGNNGYGVCGVLWKTQILTVVPSLFSTVEMVAAIEYAVMRNVKIINVSASTFLNSEALRSALLWAGEHGVIFTFATPNVNKNVDVDPDYPISWNLPNVIGVNYADKNGNLDPFVAWGHTNVFITGFARRLVVAQWLDRSSTEAHAGPWPFVTNGFTFVTGASFAAPQVASVLALIKAEYPNETIEQNKQRLRISSRRNLSLVGKTVSGGTLDAYRALAWSPPTMQLDAQSNSLTINTSEIGRYWLETSTNVESGWSEVLEITATNTLLPNAMSSSLGSQYYRIRMDNE